MPDTKVKDMTLSQVADHIRDVDAKIGDGMKASECLEVASDLIEVARRLNVMVDDLCVEARQELEEIDRKLDGALADATLDGKLPTV